MDLWTFSIIAYAESLIAYAKMTKRVIMDSSEAIMKKGVYYSNLENEFYVVTNIPEINSNRLIFMFMVYDNGTSTWIWLNKPTKEFLKESCVYVGEF